MTPIPMVYLSKTNPTPIQYLNSLIQDRSYAQSCLIRRTLHLFSYKNILRVQLMYMQTTPTRMFE